MTQDPTATDVKEIAVLLLDTQNPVLAQFGDFADQGIKLLANSTTATSTKFKYTKYNIIEKQEFPTPEQLSNLHGIYLTGSRSDSFRNEDWILNLTDFLKDVLINHTHIRIVGICFGHQVLAKALGLTTGRNVKGWEMGVTEIQLNDQLNDPLFDELTTKPIANTFNIVEMHQDIVLETPDSSSLLHRDQIQILGSTEICKFQGFYKPKQILTFQGHPEFNLESTGIMVDSRFAKGLLDEDFYNGVLERNKVLKSDEDALGRIIVRFLDF